MVCWGLTGMALGAVIVSGVVKAVIRPGSGVMALGAGLPIVAIRGIVCMALRAIGVA